MGTGHRCVHPGRAPEAPLPVRGPAPQSIPQGGATVDLSNLSQPTTVEDRLRSSACRQGRTQADDTRWHGAAGKLQHRVGGEPDRPPARGRWKCRRVWQAPRQPCDASGRCRAPSRAAWLRATSSLLAERSATWGARSAAKSEAWSRPSASGVVPAQAAALSPVESVFYRIAGVVGVFLTLVVLGFGVVIFGRQNLEIVSDTVSHSFGRSFVTGLLGQILLLPTFGMLVVGLILSVAGILLLPFAVAVFAMLVVVGVVGGYLAVAHALGETYTRRRMALGVIVRSPNSYRYLLIGLLAIASLWSAWALFGWVPVAGSIMWGAAFFVSWLLGTAGFGAALLSRAGIKENFSGRLFPPEAMTDEYLWATPQFGVPAGRRPGTRTPSRGL